MWREFAAYKAMHKKFKAREAIRRTA